MGRPGPFALMRKNWKKSTVMLTTAYASLWYTYDYSVTNDVMKTSSRRAAAMGDQKLKSFDAQPRHITVILNPVAGKRKSKKLYSKWVEPLLHLAGIKVSLVETESPNQAYHLMQIMSNCDAVAIVGGDGTVHEALNGLLHRPDCHKAARDFPIAIMPTGQFNSIARYIHQGLNYRNQKEFLIQSTLRLIDSVTEQHDVLKITPLNEPTTTTAGATAINGTSNNDELPIYALRDVRYGKYQDNFFKVSGYVFYQTYIKPIWLRVTHTFSSSKFPNPQIESISYTEPCAGCSKCISKHKLKGTQLETVEEKSTNRRWWGSLAPVSKTNSGPSEEEKKELELAKRDNPDCDKWLTIEDINNVTDFRACMMGEKKVRLSLGRDGEYSPSEAIETQDVRLKVATNLDNDKRLADIQKKEGDNKLLEQQASGTAPTATDSELSEKEKEVTKKDEEDKTVKFLIDGQPTQAHSIEISTLSKCVTIFTGAYRIIPTVTVPISRPMPKY